MGGVAEQGDPSTPPDLAPAPVEYIVDEDAPDVRIGDHVANIAREAAGDRLE